MLMLQVSLLCTNASPTLRPSMSKVVSLLQGLDSVQPLLPVLSRSANGSSSNGIRKHFWQNVVSENVSFDPTSTESSESRLEDDGSVRPILGSINSLSTGRSSPRGIMKNFRQHPFETQSMSMYRTCTESFESLAGDDEGVKPLQGSMSSVY